MNLHRALGQLHAISRPLVIFAALWGSQALGFLDGFLDQNPILRVETLNEAFIALLLLVTGKGAVEHGVGKIWNRLTPVKDKATYIESELCYATSASIGMAIFCMLWLQQPLITGLMIMALVALASCPAILIAWRIQIWREKLSPHIESIKPEDIEVLSDQHFWKRSWAYVIAAIVFNAATTLCLQAIFKIKTGEFVDWWSLTSSCALITFITLVVFGKFIVGIGHSVLKLMNVSVMREQLRHSLAYLLGYMTFLTVIAGITLIAMYVSDPDCVSTWWAYGIAYIVIAFCAALAGSSFGYLYTPRNKAS